MTVLSKGDLVLGFPLNTRAKQSRVAATDRSQAIRDVLREHDRTLKDFERLRQRLQSDASLD
ncbi:MAG TPA: hypothetical protein VFB70_00340 [Pyrinomonadaceae bacterium]|nr:hypothetical protein [Pyrinomonadaceae bacterium]